MINIGIPAAAGTSCCWSATSMFFAAAGRRIGSFTVNQYRIVMAVALLSVMHWILLGSPWPSNVLGEVHFYFLLSGIIGLVLGDTCYFASLVVIGPKRAAVMMTLSTAAAAVVAWITLGETVGIMVLAGMAVTIVGISIAVTSGKIKRLDDVPFGTLAFGIVLGLLGAFGQGAGIAVAKLGLSDAPAISGTLIRMSTAAVFLWTIALVQVVRGSLKKKKPAFLKGLGNGRAVGYTFGGAFCGPFLGVWMSLVAVANAPIAVATTIMATFPILIIPIAAVAHREPPRAREIVGACVAVAGVALLFL